MLQDYKSREKHFQIFKIVKCSIRQRNINWQDWKYASFVIFIGHSQSIRRHNAVGRDKLVAEVVENT